MFRKYFEELHRGIESLHELINRLNKKEEITSVSLMRHILGSIDVSEEPNEEVFNNRAGAIFKDVIEPKLKKMVREQERFATAEAANLEQFWFARGSLNGIELVREEFEKAYGVYQQSNQPPEPFDKQNPLPEV
jgi:hypothetical protein